MIVLFWKDMLQGGCTAENMMARGCLEAEEELRQARQVRQELGGRKLVLGGRW